MAERDLRSELLNTLLITPHRDLAELYPVHEQMIQQDPLFYMHMAAWYADHGQVRDHKEMFVVMLCLSAFEGHREVGLALLRELPPYEVARVVDFIKGSTVKRRTPKLRLRRSDKPEYEIITKDVGLFKNVPRSMRTEIVRYLREREADPRHFDRTVMTARRSLKRLYAGLHIRPLHGRRRSFLMIARRRTAWLSSSGRSPGPAPRPNRRAPSLSIASPTGWPPP